MGCGCHEDRRPRRRWTDANSLSDSHSRLSYWSYRKSAVREPPARRRRERCHEGSRWRPSPGSLAQPTTLRDRRPIVMSLSRTGAPLEVMSTHRFQSIVNCKGGKGPSTPACNPRATAHHCSARDAVAGPTPNATADKRDSAHIGREGGETRAVGCGRLSQGQTMRAEGRHVPHMSPFTVELILTAVHCLLIGRPRAPSSPTAREMPRGVAVASIARLPSSTNDARASGSTADRHGCVC